VKEENMNETDGADIALVTSDFFIPSHFGCHSSIYGSIPRFCLAERIIFPPDLLLFLQDCLQAFDSIEKTAI
jgi:hypothetical protein